MHNSIKNFTENFEYCKIESAELISLTSHDVANFMRKYYKNLKKVLNEIQSDHMFRKARVLRVDQFGITKGPLNPTERICSSIILYWWKIWEERSKLAIVKWNEIGVYTMAKQRNGISNLSKDFQSNDFTVSFRINSLPHN